MKRSPFYLVLIFILLTGCGGLYYFDLHVEPDVKGGSARIDKTLLVEDISSNETYWTQRIVFRKGPYQLEFFTFKQWAKRPGEMVEDAMVHFYRNSNSFNKVTEEYSSVVPDLFVKANIYSLEMVRIKKGWYAHLALELEFIDKKTEKVILTHSFDRKEEIKGRKARYLPEKISLILREELIKTVDKLALKF